MDEPVKFLERLGNPASRRLWLLSEALRCVLLDRAVELARAAEAFITATPVSSTSDVPVNPETGVSQKAVATPDAGLVKPLPSLYAGGRKPLELTMQQRERLLDRLAQDVTNAALAEEFSLTSRQVQGVRMGAAREIAQRRNRRAGEPADLEDSAGVSASPEDIVRYLRQQDDVVVPQEGDQFLVNGRFRLGLTELVSRANRMRNRQGKPEFRLANGHASHAAAPHPSSRHPIFWKEPVATSN